MKCAIMQPTYLPWAGYFNLMESVDLFVLLDDVQFNKRSWQQRNRILLEGKEKILTIPVKSKGRRDQLIIDAEVDKDTNWYQNHLLTIKNAYKKHPYGEEAIDLYLSCIDPQSELLIDINRAFIQKAKTYLDINTKLIKSSQLPVYGKKSEYLINICNYLDADTYLSPQGSFEYIQEEDLFRNTSIKLEYQNYNPKSYIQKEVKEFIPYLSILDIIANIGLDCTKKYIK